MTDSMSEMVRRVAQVFLDDHGTSALNEVDDVLAEKLARAAIDVMREPADKLRAALVQAHGEIGGPASTLDMIAAAIDAYDTALKEP